MESRDGELTIGGGHTGGKEKGKKDKGKKEKGKKKDKPTMLQKLGSFMMMIPVGMQVIAPVYVL